MSKKTRTVAVALALLIAGTSAGTTFAAPPPSQAINESEINKIYYSVHEGVARVYAQVDSPMEKKMIETLLSSLDNIDKVESLIVVKK